MKYLLLLAVIAAGGFVIFAHAQGGDAVVNPYAPDLTWEDLQAIYRRRDALAARWESTHRFHNCLEATKRDLWQGKRTLAAAADALCEAGTREGYTFDCVPHAGDLDLSKRERAALILLRHLREETGTAAVPSGRESVPDELRCELASWPGVNPATLETLATEDSWCAAPPPRDAPAP